MDGSGGMIKMRRLEWGGGMIGMRRLEEVLAAMEIKIGKEGLDSSWQREFPEETKCAHCGGMARIGFTGKEHNQKGGYKSFICSLHKNDPKGEGFWLHDACSVAVYFCKECLKPTALYNQA